MSGLTEEIGARLGFWPRRIPPIPMALVLLCVALRGGPGGPGGPGGGGPGGDPGARGHEGGPGAGGLLI
jgi:hypothetical protein